MENKLSVRKILERKIKHSPKGKLFILSDFDSIADYNSIKTNVRNLVKDGVLEKVFSGIYMKPNYSELLEVYLQPDIYELARTYARKFNWIITPSGSTALNVLGLDTQVPARMNFISTGPTRRITFGNREILFRHKVLRDSNYSEPTALLIEGLKTYKKIHGEDAITNEILQTINKRITEEQFYSIEKELVNTRAWIRDCVKKMKEMRKQR
jgi:hypothetical protein